MNLLNTALILLAEGEPSPLPTIDPNLVSPGFVGFITMAILVVIVVFLIADMQRRIRRTRYREEIEEMLDAEAAEQGRPDEEPPA